MHKVKILSSFSIFISIAILVVFILIWIADSPRPVECNIEKSPVRQIIHSSMQIEGLWGVKIYLENFEQSLPMVSTPELLIAARYGCNEVTAFHLQSGDIAWKTEQNDAAQKRFNAINNPENLALDYVRHQIYVSGDYEIRAISISDGTTIWRNVSDQYRGETLRVLIREDGQLTVKTNRDWYIDPDSGDLSEKPIVIATPNSEFVATVDPQVSQILSTLKGYRIISNAVRKNDVMYVLDSDAKLHLLNVDNGEEIGLIQFEPPKKTELLYAPGAIGGSWVSVETDTLAVYFQDTDTLSVYKISFPK